jgi:hypothetical protein
MCSMEKVRTMQNSIGSLVKQFGLYRGLQMTWIRLRNSRLHSGIDPSRGT